MSKEIRWGIIGLGKIAHKFAQDLLLVEHATIAGVASRSIEKAQEFKNSYHATNAYGDYEELAMASDVDIIYVATPHSLHFENTKMCLNHGKHVLCEKPMGLNEEQVKQMVALAQEKNLFLMEGIWTRFMPSINKFMRFLNQNMLGELHYLKADFGFKVDAGPESRLIDKSLGGGSLLDIGIYPIFLSMLTYGKPNNLKADAILAPNGIDLYCSILADFEGNKKATLESSFISNTPTEAVFYGVQGYMKLHTQFHQSTLLELRLYDHEESQFFELPYKGNGYVHEIEHVQYCLHEGKSESDKLPLDLSLNLSSTLDEVKKLIGLSYT